MRQYDICRGETIKCMNNILNRMGGWRVVIWSSRYLQYFSGEFDEVHVEGKTKRQKCRAACEDQINSMFITTSSYPNRETFQHQEEFCIVTKRLLNKCNSHKRPALDRKYPELCVSLQPLATLRYSQSLIPTVPQTFIFSVRQSFSPSVTNLNFLQGRVCMQGKAVG